MKVLIIGANGKIGRILSKKISVSEKYQATVFIRKEEQRAFFNELGVPAIVSSLENSKKELGKVIKDFDAVVFTAGSGGKTGYDKTLEIDLDGAIKAINAAKENNIKRFIMVSAAHADDRPYWERSSIKPYYIAKHYADKELSESELDYTILRPVRLTDEPEAGEVRITNDPNQLEREIPRVAVAETILAVLKDKDSYGKILEMSSGELSIANALLKVFGKS
ncbi:NAD(P)-binding oxidoreductase [Maribellus maritimus]|uniref:NAD(P)-binding oxidoreductase n=1 Tax=Maribellus maritimus TaxID=2870838 RepID=UPI001EEC3303|nr:NAD(P)-binding oxidoreductase [Maribellus maritimus]MCG6189516.1 SDR family oxidoreductase [Maribellus maritimus]